MFSRLGATLFGHIRKGPYDKFSIARYLLPLVGIYTNLGWAYQNRSCPLLTIQCYTDTKRLKKLKNTERKY